MSNLKDQAECVPSEFEDTILIANHILELHGEDPDSQRSMLSRQFLRAVEREKALKQKIEELNHWYDNER